MSDTPKTESKEYIPYGPEWQKEMMKWNKPQLIDWLRSQLIKQQNIKKILDEIKH